MTDTDPANDGRLRTANIQGFHILQWCSLPIRRWFGYHTSQALTISLDRLPRGRFASPRGLAAASDHGHSAIDVNGLPGDVRRFVRTEIDRRRSDFLWRPEARSRNLGKDRFALLVVERIRHWGRDESGGDAVG